MSWLDNLPFMSRRKVKLTEPSGWGIDRAWAGHSVTPDTAMQRSAAWACVRLNARTVGSLPIKVYQKTPDGKRRLATEHPLHAIINATPNHEQTAMEFWEGQATALNLRGFAYAEKKKLGGRLVALLPMDPDRVTVYRTASGERRYRYYSKSGQPRDLGEDDVFHLRGFGAGGDNGLSPIGYARQTLSASAAAEEVAGRTFASGLQLAGFVEDQPGAKTTNDQRKDLIELFKQFEGSSRAGKVMAAASGSGSSRSCYPAATRSRRRALSRPRWMAESVKSSPGRSRNRSRRAISFPPLCRMPTALRSETARSMGQFQLGR